MSVVTSERVPGEGVDATSGVERPNSSTVPPGKTIGRYLLLQKLGEGAMGAVYAAYDSELDRKVALKFLHTRVTGGGADDWRARLVREAKAMARLSHPNVVTLYDVDVSSGGDVFLAMELMEGGTLTALLAAEKRGWKAIVELICEAGAGLEAAHRAGIIHRDFKLDNILVDRDGHPKVTDFGLARAAGDRVEATNGEASERPPTRSVRPADAVHVDRMVSLSSSTSLPRLTMTGAMLGTPGYMAPEQYTNDIEIDARADIFAFASTMYRALYGERPFEGETLEQVAEATVLGRVRPAPKGTDVPSWVREVLLRGLAVDPEHRPATMRELLDALRADPAGRRRRWLAAGAVVAVVAAAALWVREAAERPVRACHVMADRLGGVWDAPRKEAIHRAFAATGAGNAEGTWERTAGRLDAYATAWTHAMEDACMATRVRKHQSETVLDLRASCLEERLDALSALGTVFTSADAKTVQNAVRAASALPALSACEALDQLSVGNRLPEAPQARADVRALQGEVASSIELAAAGKQAQARERLDAVRARVEGTGFGPLLTAWTAAAASCDQTRDPKAATAEWQRAFALAETYRMDRERAEIEVGLGGTLADRGELDASHLWLGFASATLARIGGDPRLELHRDVTEAFAYLVQDKGPQAVPLLEHALARADAEHVDSPIDVADAHSFLGGSLMNDPARFADAVRHAREAMTSLERALGTEHISVAVMASNLSAIETSVGELGAAVADAARSLAIYERAAARGEISTTTLGMGSALGNEGDALYRLGRYGEALAMWERARAIFVSNDAKSRGAGVTISLADAQRALGDGKEAAHLAAEARRLLTGLGLESDAELAAKLFTVEGALDLDAGRAAEAVAHAERAAVLAESGHASLYVLSTARVVLARALLASGGDPARARTTAQSARDGFMQLRDQVRADEAGALTTHEAR